MCLGLQHPRSREWSPLCPLQGARGEQGEGLKVIRVTHRPSCPPGKGSHPQHCPSDAPWAPTVAHPALRLRTYFHTISYMRPGGLPTPP